RHVEQAGELQRIEGQDRECGAGRQTMRGRITHRQIDVQRSRAGDEDEAGGGGEGEIQPPGDEDHGGALAEDGKPAQANQRVEPEPLALAEIGRVDCHVVYYIDFAVRAPPNWAIWNGVWRAPWRRPQADLRARHASDSGRACRTAHPPKI